MCALLHFTFIKIRTFSHFTFINTCNPTSQVQGCPDPESWAATLTGGPDFAPIPPKLSKVVDEFDPLQLRE